MTSYRTSFTTSTPVDVVFEYLSRFSTAAEWDPGVVEAHDLTSGPVRIGSAFHIVSAVGPLRAPLRYEIVEMQRPRLVVLRAENWSVTSLDTITVDTLTAHRDPHAAQVDDADQDGVTTVTYDAELTPRGVTRLAAPLLALAFRRIGDKAAAGLRSAVDGLADRQGVAATGPTP